jgi:outer membrane immunogenic protein
MTRNSAIARLALASVSTLALSAAAQAQPVNWTGFYVGLNAGGAWGRSDVNTTVPCPAALVPGVYFTCTPAINTAGLVATTGSGTASGSGFTGGGQLGYNWQNGSVVLGLEADIEAFRIKATRQASGTFTGFAMQSGSTFTVTSTVDTNWLFTGRARAGVAFGDVLAYVTGGVAVTDLRASHSYVDNFTFGGFTPTGASGTWGGSSTRVGWTVGGGLEWALNRNWSVKAEYLYLNFGSITTSGVVTQVGAGGYSHAISTAADLTAHIARAGVNFRF